MTKLFSSDKGQWIRSKVISCPIRREVKHCDQKEGGKGLGAMGLLVLQDDSGDLSMNASPQMLYPDL